MRDLNNWQSTPYRPYNLVKAFLLRCHMSETKFRKMNGLGKDFVVRDCRAPPLSLGTEFVKAIADREAGIGCDQLIALEPSKEADVFMRIWNADGGEVAACGNAARGVAPVLGDARRRAAWRRWGRGSGDGGR